jgi:hypothetical protein
VIRLVTQFDGPAARPSVAAPAGASGCCSSCCCCVATVIGVSAFSTIHVRSLRLKALRERAEVEPRPADSSWPEVLGAFALAIALIVSSLLGAVSGGALFFAFPLVWGFLLYRAYRGAGDPSKTLHAILTVIAGVVIFVVEFVIWAAALGA